MAEGHGQNVQPQDVKPLAGIRVIDLTQVVAGPACTFYLASLGAEVIRVDRPGGDVTWNTGPFVDADGGLHDTRGDDRIPFSHLRRGRGKRSVVLDLKEGGDIDTFRKLVATADVVVENMRAGVMDRLGIGFKALSAAQPRLIWCAITGYGQTGPRRNDAAIDIAIQARSGLLARTGPPGSPPVKTGVTVADLGAAVWAALGVTAAVRRRDLTGLGGMVDVAMLDVLAAMMWDEPFDLYQELGFPLRHGNGDPRGAPVGVFRASDGWVAIVTSSEEHWRRLSAIIGVPDHAAKYPSPAARAAARDIINDAVEAWTSTRTRAEVEAVLAPEGIPVGPVTEPLETARDPQIAHRGLLERLAIAGRVDTPTKYLGSKLPIAFDGLLPSVGPVEPLGASTEAVLDALKRP